MDICTDGSGTVELSFGNGKNVHYKPTAVTDYWAGGIFFGAAGHYTTEIDHYGRWFRANDSSVHQQRGPSYRYIV